MSNDTGAATRDIVAARALVRWVSSPFGKSWRKLLFAPDPSLYSNERERWRITLARVAFFVINGGLAIFVGVALIVWALH